MSGHSKWATTKHKKAVVDAKRSKMFAKLIKNIEVAARTGGGDPAGNPTLYDAIQKAKKSSVPNNNIENAVKRGSGAEAGGADYQTIMYEGYGPNGVAVLIECLTDNRNRAAAEVRTALTRNGGTPGRPGQRVLHVHPQGRRRRPEERPDRGRRPHGACSTPAPRRSTTSATRSRCVSEATDLVAVRTALQEAGIDYDSAEAQFVPSTQVPLDEDGARKIFRLIDALEDSDDVQNVYANFDVSDEVMEALDADRTSGAPASSDLVGVRSDAARPGPARSRRTRRSCWSSTCWRAPCRTTGERHVAGLGLDEPRHPGRTGCRTVSARSSCRRSCPRSRPGWWAVFALVGCWVTGRALGVQLDRRSSGPPGRWSGRCSPRACSRGGSTAVTRTSVLRGALDIGPSYVVVALLVAGAVGGRRFERVPALVCFGLLAPYLFDGLTGLDVTAVGHATAVARRRRRRLPRDPPRRTAAAGARRATLSACACWRSTRA